MRYGGVIINGINLFERFGLLSLTDLKISSPALKSNFKDVPGMHGCLQDSHWSGGSFGYFPSYALGSAYGAQMLANMEKDIDVWGPVGRGDLSQVTGWLREKVHKYGSLLTPDQVIAGACGTFDPTYYTDYLTKKYSALYGL